MAAPRTQRACHAGLEVRVRNATMSVDDGIADDTFYLVNLADQPLSEARAADVAERVREYVTFCSPDSVSRAVEWRNGPVIISNKGDDTSVTVIEPARRIGARP